MNNKSLIFLLKFCYSIYQLILFQNTNPIIIKIIIAVKLNKDYHFDEGVVRSTWPVNNKPLPEATFELYWPIYALKPQSLFLEMTPKPL